MKTILGFDVSRNDPVMVQVFMPGDDTSSHDLSRPAWFVAPAPTPPAKRRTRSIDRTRSARWRAGSRRTRRHAHRRGPCPPPRDPWAGWTNAGWIAEDSITVLGAGAQPTFTIVDETRVFDETQLMDLYRKYMTTSERSPCTETELISLAGCSLGDIRTDESQELTEAVRVVLNQVERPRANLGGGGPPGRAD